MLCSFYVSMFMSRLPSHFFFFFFNDTATTEIYTLSLHDALPISGGLFDERESQRHDVFRVEAPRLHERPLPVHEDRKSTRLNSSHSQISYAVFCLKKKKKKSNKHSTNSHSLYAIMHHVTTSSADS